MTEKSPTWQKKLSLKEKNIANQAAKNRDKLMSSHQSLRCAINSSWFNTYMSVIRVQPVRFNEFILWQFDANILLQRTKNK